MSDPEYC